MLPKRLSQQDRPAVRTHLEGLDAQDLRLRFGYLPPGHALDHYIDALDFAIDVLYGCFDRQLRLVGLSHLAMTDDPAQAEFAVSVWAQHRCQGIGLRLLQRCLEHASNAGLQTVTIQTLAWNRPMLQLVIRHPHEMRYEGVERVASVPVAAGDVWSGLHERAQDEWAALGHASVRNLRTLTQLWRTVRAVNGWTNHRPDTPSPGITQQPSSAQPESLLFEEHP